MTCPAPFGQWSRKRGGREYRGVRTTRYTYCRDLNGPWLLYDNDSDPFQLNNRMSLLVRKILKLKTQIKAKFN